MFVDYIIVLGRLLCFTLKKANNISISCDKYYPLLNINMLFGVWLIYGSLWLRDESHCVLLVCRGGGWL